MRQMLATIAIVMTACGGGNARTRNNDDRPPAAEVQPHRESTLDRALDRVRKKVRDIPRERITLDDAVASGAISMRVLGGGVHRVTMLVTANADLELVVPAGAFFKGNGSVQNMIVTKTEEVLLDKGVEERVELATACTNFHRSVPGEAHRFELAAAEPKLKRLVVCLDEHHVAPGRTQVLVWEHTDGVKRSDLVARPDMLRPYLLETCSKHVGRDRCEKLVDAAYEHVLDKLLANSDGSVCVER